MKEIVKILFYLLILEVTFAIHEYGHLREYQKQNVPIKEFSLGIGPTVCRYQAPNFLVSLRLLPIMAYVEPTSEGFDLFEKRASSLDKITVSAAGVRNNFLIGLSVVILLQVQGWMKGNLSLLQLIQEIIVTPFKILLRFLSFLIGCITFGHVKTIRNFLLSTGGIHPPEWVEKFIVCNLTLGVLNLAPVLPLDGGRILDVTLLAMGNSIHMPRSGLVAFILFIALLTSLRKQDMRVLECERKE